MQYDNYDEPFLVGLKFLDHDGKTLLAAGLIEKRQGNKNFPIREVTLEEGERLVGVSSKLSKDEKYA
jgi:hypothetical protein